MEPTPASRDPGGGHLIKPWPASIRQAIVVTAIALSLACGSRPIEKASGRVRSDAPAESDRIVALVTIDTWRWDAFSYLGESKASTPNLDRLAREGVTFVNAYAHAVVTLPSHASVLTGLYPHSHGIRDNAGFRLDERFDTLATHFKRAGYRTAAFVSAFPLDSRYGLHRDFDVYDDGYEAYAAGDGGMPQRPGVETVKRALAWLDRQGDEKVFIWLHLYEPHFPYEPPEPYRTQYSDAPYYGEVAYADALLAPFIERLRRADRATAAITSDHGEGLGDHGELTHGVFAYNATLKVPLIVWSPHRLRPGEDAALARHIDILPTLLALNGFAGEPVDGLSLLSRERPQTSYFEALSPYLNRGWAPLRGCVDGEKKAIELPILELYDLALDPGESKNLAERDASLARAFLLCAPNEVDIGWNRADLTEEERVKLEALGYVASSTPAEGSAQLKDPKLLIEYDRRFQSALAAFQSGRRRQGLAALESLTRDQPQMTVAFLYLSDFYEKTNQIDKAVQTLRRSRVNGSKGELTARKLALFLVQTGSAEEALTLMEPFAESKDPETHSALGKIYSGLGQAAKAEAAFLRSLALDPNHSQTRADFGAFYLYQKNNPQAERLFRQSLEQNPRNANAWNGLGVVLARKGDADGAAQAWERAIEHDASLSFCYYNLAVYYERKGQTQLALARLKTYAGLVSGAQRQEALRKISQLERKQE